MDKRDLMTRVDEKQAELLELCSALIKIPSINPPGDVEEIVRYIVEYLSAHGIESRVVRPVPETPNIIATMGKMGKRTLILNGHCDVVPIGSGEKWEFDPFGGEIQEGKILGRGASDMKCGLAGLLFAMGILADEKIELDGQLVLTVVPDEEVSGVWGSRWLVESGTVTGTACLIAEPTGSFNCEIGQKGSCWLRLTATGVPAHGSLSPFVGDNAIVKLLKVLNRLETIRELTPRCDDATAKVIEDSRDMARRLLSVPGVAQVIDHCTVNIGKINGGTKVNMVPDSATSEVDIRTPLGVSADRVEEKLLLILKESGVTGVTYDFTWRSDANKTDEKADIVETVAANVKNVWGKTLSRTYQWASSDARFFRYAGIETLQYGPANLEGIHAYNETVNVEDVINATKVYVGTIMDYLR